MADDSDPPRQFFRLKGREFESANPRASEPAPDAAPTDVQGLIRAANARAPERLLSRGSGQIGSAPPTDPNDVSLTLQDNLARANAAGLNELPAHARRRSKRKRDYWLLLLPVNGFFAFCALGPYSNPMTLVYGLAGIGLYTASLTWVMFGVMDDY